MEENNLEKVFKEFKDYANQASKGITNQEHDQNNIIGDLYVTIDVDFPKGAFDNEQREGNSSTDLSFFEYKNNSFSYQNSIATRIETSTVQWLIVVYWSLFICLG